MTWLTTFEVSSAWLLVPLLLAVIAFDLRFMKIPNVLVGLFILVFFVTVPAAIPLDMLAWRVAIAFGVLVAGILAFAAGVMGGGDAKVLAALALLIPTSMLTQFALLLSVCLIAGFVLLVMTRRALADVKTGWKCLHDRRRYPMGLSIGMAGISLLCLGPNLTTGM